MRAPAIRLSLDEIITDNFAGFGGASEGIVIATGREPDIAINHNRVSLHAHALNHPNTVHICEDVFDVVPRRVVGKRRVGLAWFSPDCTYHSKARGGKPFRDRDLARRVRGLAWVAVKWAEQVAPRVIIIENVEEFEDWGPISRETGRPNPERRGEYFRKWKRALERLGYRIEWRQLRACDFGSPTSRKRLFVVARNDGEEIVWPTPSHGPGARKPWRTAGECLDFSIPVPSIFLTPEEARAWARAHGRGIPRRPLADNTLRRIARGMDKFIFKSARPFIVNNLTNNVPRSVDEPLSTLLTGNHKYLCAPTLIQTGWGEREGQAPRCLDLSRPLGTLMAGGNKHAIATVDLSRADLVAGFIAKHFGGHESPGSSMTLPMDTITTRDHNHAVAVHLAKLYGTSHSANAEAPMPTITANGNHIAAVYAFMVVYFGNEKTGGSLFNPLRTVTTKDRCGLVIVTIGGIDYAIVDIGMRMLEPPELARATGFPDDYILDFEMDGEPITQETQVRLIGNAVPPDLAAAVAGAQFQQQEPRKVAA